MTTQDTLRDLLASYPRGGVAGLAARIGVSHAALYRLAAGELRKRPVRYAQSIARVFGRRRVLGRRVTPRRILTLWAEARERCWAKIIAKEYAETLVSLARAHVEAGEDPDKMIDSLRAYLKKKGLDSRKEE